MAQQYPQFIWHNGAIKPWAEATTHVMAHALHYGSSVFEGIRSYATPNGQAIFRLSDHLRRLYHSAKIYDMPIPYTLAELAQASRDVIKANKLDRAYLRPVAFRGLGGFGLSAETPTDVAVAAWEMGPYLGEGVLEAGIDACVSSWQRFAPNTIPAGAKAGGNYLSGQLVAREARRLGFGEGIALASTGLLSEGAGENLFLVFEGALHTTPVSAALLNGITRNSIITLARTVGLEVFERDIPREYLYLCDELFMCGTAAEITPIRSVDGKPVGSGKPGPSRGRCRSCSLDFSTAPRPIRAGGWKRSEFRFSVVGKSVGVLVPTDNQLQPSRNLKSSVATAPPCGRGASETRQSYSSHSRRTMARPSPAPLPVAPSPRTPRSKSFSASSILMPGPESSTMTLPGSAPMMMFTSPCGVYLNALPMRLPSATETTDDGATTSIGRSTTTFTSTGLRPRCER